MRISLHCAPAKDSDFEQIKEQWIADAMHVWFKLGLGETLLSRMQCATIGSVRVRNTRL